MRTKLITLTIASGVAACAGAHAGDTPDRGCIAPMITQNPASRAVCPTSLANYSAMATGTALTYQWQLEVAPDVWAPLSSTPTPLACPMGTVGGTSLATSPTSPTTFIALRPCEPMPGTPFVPGAVSVFRVRCLVTNTCGREPSLPATYTVCPVDINCAGGVSVQDIFDFLSAWFAGSNIGNFNGVGGATVQDIFDFLTAWFVGC